MTWRKLAYGCSFGAGRARLAVATGSTVQTGKAGRSGETGVTLLSPATVNCDDLAWVSLLSGESRGT